MASSSQPSADGYGSTSSHSSLAVPAGSAFGPSASYSSSPGGGSTSSFVFTAASPSTSFPASASTPAASSTSFHPRQRSAAYSTAPVSVAVHVQQPFSPPAAIHPPSTWSAASPPSSTSSSSSASSVPLRKRALLLSWRAVRHRPLLLLTAVAALALFALTVALTSSSLSEPSTPSPTVLPLWVEPPSSSRLPLSLDAASHCRNSAQGKVLIVDERGVVCDRRAVDPASGCCVDEAAVDALSCRSCRPDLGCCHSYEFCVSCCMGRAGGAFDQCLARCRTSSRSIKHGNVYRHTFHHCYGAPNALTQPTEAVNASLADISAAPLGASCHLHCAARSLTCVDALLALANSCAQLEAAFTCAGCEVSEGADQPAWVSSAAGKGFPEGRCLVNRLGAAAATAAPTAAQLSCDGRHEKTRRLCVCVPELSAEDESGHFDGDEDT